jgi:hypothetical protein
VLLFLAVQIHLLGLGPARSFLRCLIQPPPDKAVDAALTGESHFFKSIGGGIDLALTISLHIRSQVKVVFLFLFLFGCFTGLPVK